MEEDKDNTKQKQVYSVKNKKLNNILKCSHNYVSHLPNTLWANASAAIVSGFIVTVIRHWNERVCVQ